MALRNRESQMARSTSEIDLKALTTGEFSDAQVECDGRTWAVHRVIVGGRSRWFKKALNGEFKEAADMKITIQELPAGHVDWLLRYIYGGDVLLTDTDSLDDNPFVALCVAHHLGDYFDMDDLCKAAIISIYRQCNSAIKFYQSNTQNSFESVVGMTRESFYTSFFAGVNMAYEMQSATATTLQEAFVEFVRRTRYFVLKCDIFSTHMQNRGEFALRMIQVLSDEIKCGTFILAKDLPYQCRKCKVLSVETGSHFARVNEWGKGGICFDCYQAGEEI